MMMHEQQQATLERTEPPMLLVRPTVSHRLVQLRQRRGLLELGNAMKVALAPAGDDVGAGGISAARNDDRVDRAACTGCALCVARVPEIMALDTQQKAVPRGGRHEWSPADGDFVRCCPEGAIRVIPATDVWRDDVRRPIFPVASSVPGARQNGGTTAR
jgi:ferredoxin